MTVTLNPPLARFLDLPLHGHLPPVGILKKVQAADTGKGLGEAHFIFIEGHHVEFQKVADAVREFPVFVEKLDLADGAVDLGAGVDEYGVHADGDDLSLDLVAHLEVFTGFAVKGFK